METTKIKLRRCKGNSPEETQLLAALLRTPAGGAADRHLWNAFIEKYERLITSCVIKALRRYGASFSRDDLDDLVGDVWLTLLRDDMKKLRQYDATRGFRIASFIGLVATHVTIDHLRARQADAAPLDEAVAESALVSHAPATDGIETRERAVLAREALAQLTNEERSFVIECFHVERSPEDLARTLGVTTNTVYSRKFKIRAKLARIVASLEAQSIAV